MSVFWWTIPMSAGFTPTPMWIYVPTPYMWEYTTGLHAVWAWEPRRVA